MSSNGVINMKELYNLAKNLKTLRKQCNYTQQYVAEQIGVSCQSYQAYEWGNAIPTLPHFIKLAQFYDVTMEELLES